MLEIYTPLFRHFEWQVAAGVCAHAGEWQAVLRLAETLEPEESSRVAPWYKKQPFWSGFSELG